jgi:hypothetical protein
VPAAQPGVRFGMTQSKQLEFQGDQDQAAVRGQLRVMSSQGRELIDRIGVAARGARKGFDSLPDPLLEQGKENIFLAFEVGVESAPGVAGAGGDVFQASRFKTILSENAFGGIQ